jgi:hypothetical protein
MVWDGDWKGNLSSLGGELVLGRAAALPRPIARSASAYASCELNSTVLLTAMF